MSIGSRLTRGKHGELLLDGKAHVIGLDTGDDTPVLVDQRLDVNINKLVSDERARQELMRIPGPGDYPDLTDYPESYPDAERRLVDVNVRLREFMAEGESYEAALRRYSQEVAKAQASRRDSNAARAGSEAPPGAPGTPVKGSPETPSNSKPGPDSGPSKA